MSDKLRRMMFVAGLAATFQRALDLPPTRIDTQMRRRAWDFWSEAQGLGLVLQ